jgi:hypothetical protein
MTNIPKQISQIGRTDTLTKGAQKALGNFRDEYGAAEGLRIYLAKAEEHGTGNTLRQKVNSVYKKGGSVK